MITPKDSLIFGFLLSALFPLIAYADAVDSFLTTLSEEILNPLVTLLFALALLYFVWGVITFISNADSPLAQETGKQHMIWGIVGMFIMVGVYGIIWFITSSLGI